MGSQETKKKKSRRGGEDRVWYSEQGEVYPSLCTVRLITARKLSAVLRFGLLGSDAS
jgi:hypothetical protein